MRKQTRLNVNPRVKLYYATESVCGERRIDQFYAVMTMRRIFRYTEIHLINLCNKATDARARQ